jgi:hypothetical protein
VRIHHERLKVAALRHESGGAVPIVLTSYYHFHRQKLPHWLTVTGADDRAIYTHDPYVSRGGGKTAKTA